MGGAADQCVASLGGLTLAQLRWIFTDWDNDKLENNDNGGVNVKSVAPNDDGDGVKEWSDLYADCKEIPINTYGAGDQSGTHDFFGEVALCKNCFKGKSGYDPEYFPTCDMTEVHKLEAMSNDASAAYIKGSRSLLGAPNCYVPSEDDDKIFNWVLADDGGIAFFGYAHYSMHDTQLEI